MKIDRKLVAAKLQSKGVNQPCHRCGREEFSIADGYTKLAMQFDLDDVDQTHLGGPAIPAVMVVCVNCGAITTHALKALDLLPEQKAATK